MVTQTWPVFAGEGNLYSFLLGEADQDEFRDGNAASICGDRGRGGVPFGFAQGRLSTSQLLHIREGTAPQDDNGKGGAVLLAKYLFRGDYRVAVDGYCVVYDMGVASGEGHHYRNVAGLGYLED